MIWQRLFNKPIGSGTRRIVKAIAVITAIYGAIFFYHNRFSFMTSKELQQKMPFKTYCVGRLAIDLPIDAVIKWGFQRINYIDVTSNPFSASKAALDYQLEQRTGEVLALPNKKQGRGLIGMEDTELPHGKIFEYFSDEWSDLEIETQVLFSAGDQLVTATYRNFLSDDAPVTRNYPQLDGIPRTRVLQLASTISTLPVSLPPASGGSCVEGVFVSGPNIYKEDITVTAYFDGVEFSINTVATEKEVIKPSDEGLLKRFSSLPAILVTELEEKRLRSRKRTINGIWHAEEFGSTGRNISDHPNYSFMLEANQPKAGLSTPELTIAMKASPDDHSQGEILTIWDTIIDSIRPRPAGLPAR